MASALPPPMTLVTRFAPSPTGRLHLGHALSAVIGHSRARAGGGRFLLRIEDLDAGRCRPEHAAAIIDDLRWLGLDWDDPPLVQSMRAAQYSSALDKLREMGLAYPCFCTRADIAAHLQAPHGPAGAAYPGTCRGLGDDAERRAATPHSWRLDSAAAIALAGLPSWVEDGRTLQAPREAIDDIVLARKDAPAAYHLACVVDDAASGVTLVARGADLRASTPVQRLLQRLLGLPEPAYHHHPLVADESGRRLAKRSPGATLADLRAAGSDGPALAAGLAAGKLVFGFRLIEA